MSAWAWPQWFIAGWFVFAGILALIKDGEPRGPWDGSDVCFTAGLFAWILWMGGFWS